MITKTKTINIKVKRKALANPKNPNKIRYDLELSSKIDGTTYAVSANYFTDKNEEPAGLDFGAVATEKPPSNLFIGSLTNTVLLFDGNKATYLKDRDLFKVRKAYINEILRDAFYGWHEGVTTLNINYNPAQNMA